ncbi:MAG: hypothetical protein Unbinned3992contig1000_33 [Prokaryotic dsDNA virus sp.]|nr:MAG: hypothetical protein Unbinned3992contig1000_33 [Prokaryotic dsDNA virus sp.]|tara:strand:+ start:3708 stop:3998 length:291 start_codon:yes stop_codon:yes gene_type:complete
MKNVKLNLPHYDPRPNNDHIERETREYNILDNTLQAHHTGLFKIESNEKYFELRRLVQRAKLRVAFFQGMPRTEVVAHWESVEKYIANEEAGIYCW